MPTFTMTQKRGGYEPAEVDAYINSLEQQLKEYEGKASAINNAIISAQMASDKMIKQANEETAELIKKAKEEAAELVKKAKDEADTIIKQANGEKDKIMAEAQKYSVAISENASEEIKSIHSNIAQQKTVIDNFTREYSSLIEKYLKEFDTEIGSKLTSDLDKIDSMVNEWEKSGLPKPAAQPAPATAQSVPNKMPAFANKPSETEIHKNEAPKPSPFAAGSISPETPEDQSKSPQPKPFIKTGLGGSGLGGIPTSPGYGLGRERTLRAGLNHNEPPKTPFNTPAPSAEAPLNNTPKPAEAPAAESSTPKPGIYKVGADNHLYNENNQPSMSKPGIYKVTSDNNPFNNNSNL